MSKTTAQVAIDILNDTCRPHAEMARRTPLGHTCVVRVFMLWELLRHLLPNVTPPNGHERDDRFVPLDPLIEIELTREATVGMWRVTIGDTVVHVGAGPIGIVEEARTA